VSVFVIVFLKAERSCFWGSQMFYGIEGSEVLKNFKKPSENGRTVTRTESADSDPPIFAVKTLALARRDKNNFRGGRAVLANADATAKVANKR
jgi:hypothetical protein